MLKPYLNSDAKLSGKSGLCRQRGEELQRRRGRAGQKFGRPRSERRSLLHDLAGIYVGITKAIQRIEVRGCPQTSALKSDSDLLDSYKSRIESRNVSSEIPAIRAHILVGTAGLEFVISPIAVITLNELNVIHARREKVACRPRQWLIVSRSSNQRIVGECVCGEAVRNPLRRRGFVGCRGGGSRPRSRLCRDPARCGNAIWCLRSRLLQLRGRLFLIRFRSSPGDSYPRATCRES
jgi:hypothetical protein